MKLNLKIIGSLLLIVFFASCKKDDIVVRGAFSQGVFITNEGPFQTGTGTVSFLDTETGTISNKIFESVNGRPLGNIVQSLEVFRGKAYIVVNNANKIEIADAGTFEEQGVIEGLGLPRCFLGINADKAYVSQWGETGSDGSIAIIDLNSLQVTGLIATGGGPENMKLLDGSVYVANSGGFGNASEILVIDPETDEVVRTIDTGDKPESLQFDTNNMLWVLCSGFKAFNPDFSIDVANSTSGRLQKIDPVSGDILLDLVWPEISASPDDLVINETRTFLYFTSGPVYKMGIDASSFPTVPFLNNFFYSLGLDPNTGIIYGSDAGDFASNGEMLRFMSDGSPIDTFEVGIIPGNFYFQF